MIEVVSHPEDLTDWDPEVQPFYFELYGETSPLVDTTYAEVLSAGSADAQAAAAAPIYEYWWTLGHAGEPPVRHRFRPDKHDESVWHKLKDPAARVYVYFSVNKGWRIKELIATVKYLSPTHNQKTLSEKAGEDWQKVQPIVAGAGSVAGAMGVIPGVGTVAAGAAPLLSALAKLQTG